MGAKSGVAYIPSLDGIRALAVLLVFFTHAGFVFVPGAFGVTVFFFLSGFLITTLLRREFDKTGRISLKNFYIRRVFRIFPPLYIVLLLGLFFAFTGILRSDMHLSAVVFQFLHLSNYYEIARGGTHFVPGTRVLWSLAAEEHFYLVFPFGLSLLMGRLPYRRIAGVLFGICLLVAAWRFVLSAVLGVSDIYNYMATDARIDSMLYGCIMGLWNNPVMDPDQFGSGKRRYLIGLGAIALLGFSFLYRDPLFRQTVRYSLQGVALFPLFFLSVRHPDWLFFRVLNWSPLRWLGIFSYTFYLWHLTGLAFGAQAVGGWNASSIVAGFLFTLSFCVVIYLVVEKPLGEVRKRFHAAGA